MKNKTTKTIACVIASLTLSACVGSVNVPAGTENKITDGAIDTTMDKATAIPNITDRIASYTRVGTFIQGNDINNPSDGVRDYTHSETQDTFRLATSGNNITMIVNGVAYDLSLTDDNIRRWESSTNDNIYIEEASRVSNDLRATLAGEEDDAVLGTYVFYDADRTTYGEEIRHITYNYTSGYATVGIQTPASFVESETATATYTGLMEFETYASKVTDIASRNSGVYYIGDLTMNIDFTAKTIDGTANLQHRGNVAGTATLALAPIVGNGFAGNFTFDDALRRNAGLINNSVGKYTGNFFGPNADDLAGVMQFNGTTANGAVIGIGGFRGDRQDN